MGDSIETSLLYSLYIPVSNKFNCCNIGFLGSFSNENDFSTGMTFPQSAGSVFVLLGKTNPALFAMALDALVSA
jgi:hypothetical protein